MYGLSKNTDLTFLLGKTMERVEVSDYQAQLHFDGSVAIYIEGECQIDGKPVPYQQLGERMGKRVTAVKIPGDGAISLRFSDGSELSILDTHSNYESYQITAPGVNIIV